MTTKSENLKTLAEMALSNARRQLEATGRLDVKIGLQHPDGRVRWLNLPEELDPIMNDPHLKGYFFGGVRAIVNQLHPTAVIMATDAWTGVPTEKQKQMLRDKPDELKRLSAGFECLADWEAAGLSRRVEAIAVTVQTPDEVLLLQQRYERADGTILWGARSSEEFLQSAYGGRTKMY
jgi:hypothetical protein